jgi:hypothetical protein
MGYMLLAFHSGLQQTTLNWIVIDYENMSGQFELPGVIVASGAG